MTLNPSYLLEVSTGFLLPLFGLMTVFALLRLYGFWQESLRLYKSRSWAWYYTYATYKPTVAIVILSVALFVRFGILWLWMHLVFARHSPGTENALILEVFIGSTVLLAFAIICWIRAVSPILIYNWQWLLFILFCLGIAAIVSA